MKAADHNNCTFALESETATFMKENIAPAVDPYLKAVSEIEALPGILQVICRVTGMRFAALACVTDGKWFACAVNDGLGLGVLAGDELVLETDTCNETRESGNWVVIDHLSAEGQNQSHPGPPLHGFRSYISVPVVLKNGSFFGTLCAIDPETVLIDTPDTIRMFAELIAYHLDAGARESGSSARLVEEQHMADLKDQFIAILGHDLRNPLAAVKTGAAVLKRLGLGTDAEKVISIIHNSSKRMEELIENTLDLAKGKLGMGITAELKPVDNLEQVIDGVVSELAINNPDVEIIVSKNIPRPVTCDQERLAQVCSNLLSNAIAHGKPGVPVTVNAGFTDTSFFLSIANACCKIPEEVQAKLFEPFVRGNNKIGSRGLGLGLYISSEIAKAHNGTLSVSSSEEETVFTFAIPLK